MAQPEWKNTCCNPFNVRGHTSNQKNLRPVSGWMCENAPHISIGARICDSCREKLSRASISDVHVESADTNSNSDAEDSWLQKPSPLEDSSIQPSFLKKTQPSSASLALVNKCLKESGKTPITNRKLKTRRNYAEKLDEVTSIILLGKIQNQKIHRSFLSLRKISIDEWKKHPSTKTDDTTTELVNLKNRNRVQCVQFHGPDCQEASQKGILSTPNPKPSHSITQTKVDMVVTFYESDESSQLMPGMKEFVSVKQPHGKRMHIQEWLILNNLRELYQKFIEKHPAASIGFSKFAELQPKHCILAGASGTHSVFVPST